MLRITLILSLIFCSTFSAVLEHKLKEVEGISPSLLEDASLSVPDLIEKYGYPCEVHTVVTPDGYILRMHRIPHGRNNDKVSKNVVFLQHGLLSSSADWVVTGVGQALAYILADAGYDVWMGNARGNSQSRNHTYLDPDHDSEFWQFSWHEIGIYDLPTMIDYVLQNTTQEDLLHIGHSQGTTSFYVMTSMKPEYNAKIKAHFSLAPIAFMNHLTSPLLQILAFWDGPLSILMDLIGINEFLPNNDFIATVGDDLCSDDDITQPLCSDVLFVLCGFSPEEMNATILPVITGHTPAGSSTKQILHYGQEVNSGYFRRYDFGLLDNIVKYGTLAPPDYDLKKITAPIYMFYSHNDWMAAEVDVEKLYENLPNARGKFLVSDGSFNHLDFIFGIHAPEFVYNKVISLMNKYKV